MNCPILSVLAVVVTEGAKVCDVVRKEQRSVMGVCEREQNM